MLANARSDLLIALGLATLPGLTIALAVESFDFAGDGARDAFDV
jgi:ABC-type dipeptide/oligopeptide/nickel transport system permease subunit